MSPRIVTLALLVAAFAALAIVGLSGCGSTVTLRGGYRDYKGAVSVTFPERNQGFAK